jgi:outer membrane protein assembly factor BamB
VTGALDAWPRKGLLACIVLAAGLAWSAAAAKDSAGEDWPQFLGPTANGISQETGLLDQWPTNGPPLVWEKSIGTGYGAQSVRGSLLVLHHRVGGEEVVEGLEAATGKPAWRYAYGLYARLI